MGIHGTLFYELDHKKRALYFAGKLTAARVAQKDEEARNPLMAHYDPRASAIREGG